MKNIILGNSFKEYVELLEHAPDPISIHSIKGEYLYVNPIFIKIVGYQKEKLLNESPLTYVHPEDAGSLRKQYHKIKEDHEPYYVEYRFKKHNGEYVWFHKVMKIIELKDSSEKYIICFIRDISEKKQMQRTIEENYDQFQSVFDYSPIGMAIVGADAKPLKCNQAFVNMLGYREEALRDLEFKEFTHPDDVELDLTLFSECLQGHRQFYQIEKRFIHKDGTVIWGRLTVTVVFTKCVEKKIKYIIGMVEDITGQKEIQIDLAVEKLNYQNLVEDTQVGVYRIQQGKLVYANARLEEITGYQAQELYTMNFIDLFVPESREQVMKNIGKRLNNEIVSPTVIYDLIRKDNEVITVELHVKVTSLLDVQTITGTVIDITARRKAEEQIEKMAYSDSLTGLPNRLSLEKHFSATVSTTQSLAILFIDMDRFKMINDLKGHKFGDLFLINVSQRFLQVVDSINERIFRYGGDEFIIILPYQLIDEVNRFCQRVIKAFSNSIRIKNQEIFTSPSIGISLYGIDGYDLDFLIKNADAAMYVTKKSGGNGFTYYNALMEEKLGRKLEMEYALRKALETNEFTLHYQPQYKLSENNIIGAEALIRWRHKDMGFVSPAEFIPIAEETGLIIPIGQWVLEKACTEFKHLNEQFGVKLSVNVSSIEIQQSDFVSNLKAILQKTNFNPNSLVLELTERIMLDSQGINEKLEELSDLGIHISIDDFGTGYSSLSVLHALPIHSIKIDKSFIDRMLHNPKSKKLVRTIIDLCLNFEYEIVAEGIEEHKQIEQLRVYYDEMIGQGFYMCKPIPIEEIDSLIKQ